MTRLQLLSFKSSNAVSFFVTDHLIAVTAFIMAFTMLRLHRTRQLLTIRLGASRWALEIAPENANLKTEAIRLNGELEAVELEIEFEKEDREQDGNKDAALDD
ncbi:hypothetical protein GMDG_06177 [Pseudogymnoascus destructans 20631-21]|uniref:Uncharacterized protein n=1 Tax=Pseudogymnoascus destructans (strain ATCC MYA-4855 / 20631-21) TaxID=658429 RepID=L8FSA1_PSED2|nr:hypothetical protein GMDG_06177 [Pseudogymnoascus destructans 20631-21]